MPVATRPFPTSARALVPAALLLLSVACADRITNPDAGPPQRLQVVSGDEQSGTVGQPLPASLVVKVTDEKGKPVSGQIVNFRVTRGGGSVYAGAAISNKDGVVREQWTLGTSTADSQVVEARAVDPETGTPLLFATFRARPKPDRAVYMFLMPRQTVADIATPVRIVADMWDRYGNQAADQLTWSVSDTAVARVVPGRDTVASDSAGGVITRQVGIVVGLKAGSVTVVGSTGTIRDTVRITFRPEAFANMWRIVPFDPSVQFGVAWTSPAGNVYAVGQRTVTMPDTAGVPRPTTVATLYRAVGDEWGEYLQRLGDMPNAGLFTCNRSGSCLGGIAGTSDNDIWIGFAVPGALYHFDGQSLRLAARTTVTDLVLADDGHVYAARTDSTGFWFHMRADGQTWVPIDTVRGDLTRSLWVGGGVHFGGGQLNRAILRYQAGVWDSIPQPAGTQFYGLPDVLRGTSPSNVWWVRDQGGVQHVMRWNGTSSSIVASLPMTTTQVPPLRTGDLWIDRRSGDVAVTGGDCRIHRLPNDAPSAAEVIDLGGCPMAPKAITGRSRGNLWVFGLNGLVAHGTVNPYTAARRAEESARR